MRSIYRFALALAGCVAVSGCQSPSSDSSAATPATTTDTASVAPAAPASPSAQAVIRGRAMYYEKIKLPPGGYLVVQLIDNQLADTPKAVIAQTRLEDVAGAPYDFVLPYEPAKLRPDGQYGLHASLYGPQGNLIFVTDARVPFTPGTEDVGEFRMKMANGRSDIAPPPRSVWDEARARGVTFRGIGNEPGWLVEVDRGDSPAMRATLDYGEREIVVPRAQGISSTPGFGGRTADGVDVVLRIERASCSDGMSDDTYPAAIKLTVGDKTYSGCGRYLDE
jgi:uncharacterized lipoprotein YbaY